MFFSFAATLHIAAGTVTAEAWLCDERRRKVVDIFSIDEARREKRRKKAEIIFTRFLRSPRKWLWIGKKSGCMRSRGHEPRGLFKIGQIEILVNCTKFM